MGTVEGRSRAWASRNIQLSTWRTKASHVLTPVVAFSLLSYGIATSAQPPRQERMAPTPNLAGPPSSIRRQYRNPPIEEALCEIRFTPSPEWDPTIPGLIYQKLQAEYPATPRELNILETDITLPIGPENEPSFKFQQARRVQLRSNDDKRFVSLGSDVISIHIVRPYSSWEVFSNQIRTVLNAYEVTAEPRGITRVEVRYINRIVVQAQVVELTDYFTSPPEPPKSLPQDIRSFLVRIDSHYDDSTRLVTAFASNDVGIDQVAFVLDISAIGEWSPPLSLADANGAIGELRAIERFGFESLITDKAEGIV